MREYLCVYVIASLICSCLYSLAAALLQFLPAISACVDGVFGLDGLARGMKAAAGEARAAALAHFHTQSQHCVCLCVRG